MFCRNPLQAVMGSISFLRERYGKDSDSLEDISAITAAAADMARVIDDISDWVKVSVGQLELQRQPVQLQPLLDEVLRLYSGYSSMTLLITATVHASCEGLYFTLDPDRVKQVLTLAMSNSVRVRHGYRMHCVHT